MPKPVDEACAIRVVRCSGTIRKAEEEAVRRAREFVVKARQSEIGGVTLEKAIVGMAGLEERDVGDVMSESEDD